MGKFKLRNGSGNATPFKLMADMELVTDTEGGPGGPGGGLPGVENKDIKNKEFKAGAKAFINDNYKETINSKTLNVPEDEKLLASDGPDYDASSNIGNEIIKQTIRRGKQTFKPKGKNNGKGKYKSVGGSIGYSTPWRRYREDVKWYKDKYIKSQPLFSSERRKNVDDLRGKADSSGNRLSFKNKYQQRRLMDRRRGRDGNTQRGFHSPHIPNVGYKPTISERIQNRRDQKEKNQNAVASNLREGGNISQRFKQKCKNRGGGQSCGIKERKRYFKR